MMHHSDKHTIRWSPPLCVVYSSVTYTNAEKNGSHMRVKSPIRQYPHGYGPYSGHNHSTCENRQWEDCYINLFNSRPQSSLDKSGVKVLAFAAFR